MRTTAMSLISRPHWKTASAILLAGAVLFAAGSAHAEPRHGNKGHGGGHHGYSQKHHASNWRQPSHHYRHDSSRFNRFSLSINSGPGYYAPTYYRPYAPAYYVAPPVVYSQPIYSQPVNYPMQPAMMNDGRYCREYTKQVWVGGRMQQSYGNACMQPDGAWEVES